ncbi:Cysteine protease atg4 [Coemansia sp. RSA 1821]|nr:Cysteine protease atg4 [Coemansia sp. RSA 1821]
MTFEGDSTQAACIPNAAAPLPSEADASNLTAANSDTNTQTITQTQNTNDIRSQVVNTLREWYLLASDSIASLLDGRFAQQPAQDLWLLGRHYDLKVENGEQSWALGYPPQIVKDFSRLIWCTYRSNYSAIAQTDFTSDAGWGCMLRAGQMLMAQALQLHYFGRNWEFDWDSSNDASKRQLYMDIVKQFLDEYSSTFSIQRMASLGGQFEGKDIGNWFGPYETARILHGLARQANHPVSVYTTTDGVVYLADICDDEYQPTLVLVASMLGIDRVNPIYYPFIQASLMLPQSAGIAGGRPSSALYFAGFQGDELLFLDPHFTRPAINLRDGYTRADLDTYTCSNPRRIALSRLDPCMVFGYYCPTLESLIDLRSRIELLADDGIKSIVTFDNGHAPEPAFQSDATASSSDEVDRHPEPPIQQSTSSSDADYYSCANRPKSESEEVISGCSEEEWVTEL